MKYYILLRMALILGITAVVAVFASWLGDGFNNPQFPGEAIGCAILFIMLIATYVMTLVNFFNKWKGN